MFKYITASKYLYSDPPQSRWDIRKSSYSWCMIVTIDRSATWLLFPIGPRITQCCYRCSRSMIAKWELLNTADRVNSGGAVSVASNSSFRGSLPPLTDEDRYLTPTLCFYNVDLGLHQREERCFVSSDPLRRDAMCQWHQRLETFGMMITEIQHNETSEISC